MQHQYAFPSSIRCLDFPGAVSMAAIGMTAADAEYYVIAGNPNSDLAERFVLQQGLNVSRLSDDPDSVAERALLASR
jgi:hypothetical protein